MRRCLPSPLATVGVFYKLEKVMKNMIQVTKTDELTAIIDADEIISVIDNGDYRYIHIRMAGDWTQSLQVKDSVSNIARASKERAVLLSQCSKMIMEMESDYEVDLTDIKNQLIAIKKFLS